MILGDLSERALLLNLENFQDTDKEKLRVVFSEGSFEDLGRMVLREFSEAWERADSFDPQKFIKLGRFVAEVGSKELRESLLDELHSVVKGPKLALRQGILTA